MDSVMNFNSAGEAMMREANGGCKSCTGGARRKLTPYNKFVKKTFPQLQKEYPAKKAPEIMKMCAKKWRESKK
jgi:hypothetical protein